MCQGPNLYSPLELDKLLIILEIIVVFMCLFNVKIFLTFVSKETLNYVNGSQTSAIYTREAVLNVLRNC